MSKKDSQEVSVFPRYVNFLKENRTKEQAIEIFENRIKDSSEVYSKFKQNFFERDCPVCGNNDNRSLPNFHDRYGVKECLFCTTKFVSPCPAMDALTYYYNECKCNALFGNLLRSRNKSGNIIISERIEFILNLIDEHFKDSDLIRILEIGCGSGVFLSEIKEVLREKFPNKKILLHGIDIDLTAIQKSVDSEISLSAESAESYVSNTKERYDLVLHFELIEHLQNPYDFMISVKNLLNQNGLHHFHTPNANGFDNIAIGYNEFRPLAHGIFPPMHLQSFTPMNIVHFSLRTGFKVVQVDTPGNFDIDIVRNFLSSADPYFENVALIPENYLAIFQSWLKKLNSSSHLRVTLKR